MIKTNKLSVTVDMWAESLGVSSSEIYIYLEKIGRSPHKLYKDTERCGWRWSSRLGRWLPLVPDWVYWL